MLDRNEYIAEINRLYRSHKVVALLGPRQCGKTTLARMYLENLHGTEINYFDLEEPSHLDALDSPKTTLQQLKGIVILDGIERLPEIFTIIRVLVDRDDATTRFLILGSASRDLINKSSESLAGRVAYLEINPFSIVETNDMDKLWLRGGFPPSYLALSIEDSISWRKNYIKTFLARDIPNLGLRLNPRALRRFWHMLAHYHGNIFNASEISRSLQINYKTAQYYLDILASTYMIRILMPWFENISKRQVKSPKIYFRDSGILHSLLSVGARHTLLTNPKLGASWEGFAMESVISILKVDDEDCYFWSTQGVAECDLIIFYQGLKLGFEFKYSDAPKVSKSMIKAVNDLQLDHLYILSPGRNQYYVREKITSVGLGNFDKSIITTL